MSSAKQRDTKTSRKAARNSDIQLGIKQHFSALQEQKPDTRLASLKGVGPVRAEQVRADKAVLGEGGGEMASTPQARRVERAPEMILPRQEQHVMEEDLVSLIQALPTKIDIEALIHKVETAHRMEMQQVHTEIKQITDLLTIVEETVSSLEERVEALEREREAHEEMVADMHLQIEDLEDRSHQ